MEAPMGRLLQVGVVLAAAVVFLGGMLYLRAHGSAPVSYRHFRPEPEQLRQVHHLARSIAHGDGASLIQLGILILIATPVARVVLAVIAFSIGRDRLYVVISVTVLCVLLLGFFHVS